MIAETIKQLTGGSDLSEGQVIETMDEVTKGAATDVQIAAFLVALRMKGETVEEIAGAARVMREKCTKIPLGPKAQRGVTDTCGTGADSSGTFNISTVSAIAAAGAGLVVAKHGNRAVTSSCGSADLLEALEIPLDLTPEEIGTCIDEVGMGFMFAPMLHGSMKYVAGPRKELGLRTVFNVLGPLTNPAGARSQLLGVFSQSLTETIARVLGRLGSERAFVVHGNDGMDEISVSAPTRVSRLEKGVVETFEVTPEQFGIERAGSETLAGGGPKENARIALDILRGEKGPKRDVVVLNTAAALAAGGVASSIEEGVPMAAHSLDSGAALEKLGALRGVAIRLKSSREQG